MNMTKLEEFVLLTSTNLLLKNFRRNDFKNTFLLKGKSRDSLG